MYRDIIPDYVQELAIENVKVNRSGDAIILAIATNIDWEPPTIDPTHGISSDEIDQLDAAGMAICSRALAEIIPYTTIKDYLLDAIARRGGPKKGTSQLAADLLGAELTPDLRKSKEYKAQLRALQRYTTTAKQQIARPSGSNLERIRSLQSREVPERAKEELKQYSLTAGILGNWVISSELRKFVWHNSDPKPSGSSLYRAVLRFGQGYFDASLGAIADAIGQEALLEICYACKLTLAKR